MVSQDYFHNPLPKNQSGFFTKMANTIEDVPSTKYDKIVDEQPIVPIFFKAIPLDGLFIRAEMDFYSKGGYWRIHKNKIKNIWLGHTNLMSVDTQ